MALKLMLITNDTEVAIAAQDSGVDWIFVDLEIRVSLKDRKGEIPLFRLIILVIFRI